MSINYSRNEIENLITAVTAGLQNLNSSEIEEVCPIGIVSMNNWEWPQGVALFSMFNYYLVSKKQEVLDYLLQWFDARIEEGLPEKNVNTMCPMLTLAHLYEITNNEKYLPVLKEWVTFAVDKLPRTDENGIQHIVSGNLNEQQIWVDTLYMTVLFVAKMGSILDDKRLTNESIYQYLLHVKYLTDKKTGLLFHGFNFQGRHNFANALWARGNSWYTAGIVDYLDIVTIDDGLRSYLLQALLMQAESLSKFQDKTGLWHTILDDDSSYVETSASAAFAYGLLKAIRLGYLPEKFKSTAYSAIDAVIKQINDKGIVEGVSYGTPVFNSIEEYKKIEICPMPYGQSMTLMLLIEILNNM